MKYLIYARVSERGSGFEGQTTIPMQIKICEDYIRLMGSEVFDRRSDEFISGKNIDDRPAFRGIMEELRSGTAGWDAIIVYKFSRISRSLRDSLNIVAELQEHGKGFVSATEQFDCTTTTGQLFFNMLQSFNEFERKRTADTIRDKMMSIAEAGLWPSGKPPFGYRRGERKDNHLYIDERNAEIVRDIFHSYLDPATPVWSIVRKYRNVLSRPRIFAILRNPVYCGVIPYGGKIFPGKHSALITQETFDRVQEKAPRSNSDIRPKAQRYPYLLGGLVECICGHRMTPASAKSGQYNYYRCVDVDFCKRRVSAQKIEQAVIDYFKNWELSKEIIEATLAKIDEELERRSESNNPELETVRTAIVRVQAERKRTFSLLLNGSLNQSLIDMANSRIADLDEELSGLQSRQELLQNQQKLGSDVHKLAKALLLQTKTFSEALRAAGECSSDDLRTLIHANIQKVIDNGDGTFRIIPRNRISSTNSKEWYTRRDSNS